MSPPAETQVEIPFDNEEVGRLLYVSGIVRLKGRWPSVRNFRAIDQRTDEVLDDLPEWIQDAAEEELIREARAMWETDS